MASDRNSYAECCVERGTRTQDMDRRRRGRETVRALPLVVGRWASAPHGCAQDERIRYVLSIISRYMSTFVKHLLEQLLSVRVGVGEGV